MAVLDIITRPDPFDDIRDTLNSSGGSVSNVVETAFKTTSGINKWSKHKPVRLDVDFCQDFSSTAANYYPNWWKGYDGNCGMTLPIYTSPGTTSSGFLHDLINGNFAWTYTPPAGTSAQPQRLGDFIEYKKSAIAPVSQPSNFNVYKNVDGDITLGFDLAVSSGDKYNLTLTDLEVKGVALSNYYLGLILYKGQSYMLVTSKNKMTGSDLSMTFNVTGVSGSYTGRLFASSVPIQIGGSLTAGTFIPLELNSFGVVINDYGTLYSVLVLGYWSSSNTVAYTAYIRNDGTGQITINDVKAVLIKGNDPESGQTLGTNNIGNVTVPAKGEVQKTGTFTATRDTNAMYWLAGLASNVTTTYTPVEDVAPENV